MVIGQYLSSEIGPQLLCYFFFVKHFWALQHHQQSHVLLLRNVYRRREGFISKKLIFDGKYAKITSRFKGKDIFNQRYSINTISGNSCNFQSCLHTLCLYRILLTWILRRIYSIYPTTRSIKINFGQTVDMYMMRLAYNFLSTDSVKFQSLIISENEIFSWNSNENF